MEILQELKVLNQPIICPWTSTAPLQSVTTSKANDSDSSKSDEKSPETEENVKTSKTKSPDEKKECQSQEPVKPDAINVKQSSSQFFHFLRLMQLFPTVHPATLHTVMTLCKNDFFVAVDKLLYAKRCKELYQNRRQLFQNFSNKNQRYSPYPCNSTYCQNVNCIKPQVIKLDMKKMVSRNRYAKLNADKQGTVCQNSSDLSPVQLQCNVPIRPLSPVSPEDLSSTPIVTCEASESEN